MSKQKINLREKRKKLFIQLAVVVMVISFLTLIIFSNFVGTDSPKKNELENAMNSKTTFVFKKQGELAFTDQNESVKSIIDIEVADDFQKRATGLMFREKMEENQGMLFLFELEEPQSFWMRNTILSLDILYVNSQKEIVKIYKNARPYSDDGLPSIKPAKYVVEVIAGYTDKYKIVEGDKVNWRIQ